MSGFESGRSQSRERRGVPYLQGRECGRVGGFCIFDAEASRDAFFESDFRATIGDAYAVIGEPNGSLFRLLVPLREVKGTSSSCLTRDRFCGRGSLGSARTTRPWLRISRGRAGHSPSVSESRDGTGS